MLIRYVCTPDIVLDSKGQQYACRPMAICNSAIDAAKANVKLDPSFGYAIYKVEWNVRRRLKLTRGMAAGRIRVGIKVIDYVGLSYDILDKVGLSFSEMREKHDTHWKELFSRACGDHS